MKKFISCLLVLVMASVAQAGFQLSVGGVPAPDEITLMPSDWIELDVHIDPGTVFNGGDFAIILSNNQGLLDPANVVYPKATMQQYMNGTWYISDEKDFAAPMASIPALSNPQKLTFSGGDLGFNAENNIDPRDELFGGFIPAVPANSYEILMQGLMFHCEEMTDVEILLVAPLGITQYTYLADGTVDEIVEVYPEGAILDSILVRQIPEPMTMALLGLGGLALIRRRR